MLSLLYPFLAFWQKVVSYAKICYTQLIHVHDIGNGEVRSSFAAQISLYPMEGWVRGGKASPNIPSLALVGGKAANQAE